MPLAALLSGALLAGASVPAPAGALAFVALVPLLRALAAAPPPGRAFRDGGLAGLVYFGVGFGWLFQAEVDGGLALPAAYALGVPALAGGTGLFAVAVALLARRSPALALAAAPGVWVAIEYVRSEEWALAVPWNHLGYALADQPALMQGASVFGLYGLSAWLVAVNAGLLWMARTRGAARPLLAAALATPLLPALPLLGDAPEAGAGRLRVAAVQPALAERERHVPERLQPNLRRLLDLTEPVAAAADLVVWPESAWERALGPGGDAFLAAIAHGLEAPLLTGVWRAPAADAPSWRNAAVLATRDGRTPVVAEKVHPVPVYERAPDGPLARLLARAGLWTGVFARGAAREPLVLPGPAPVRVGVLVCVDASHPEIARAARAAGAQLLVAIANEAGSGAWSAALHARAARLRAVENRVPVVRVANTGPTLWIDAHGRVRAALAPGEAASAVHTVELAGPPRARPRDAAVAAGCFLSALAMGAARFLPADSRSPVR
jgi:apolipoprotein N-acyltransferase